MSHVFSRCGHSFTLCAVEPQQWHCAQNNCSGHCPAMWPTAPQLLQTMPATSLTFLPPPRSAWPAFDREVADLAADVARLRLVRAHGDRVRRRAAAVALRGLGALAGEVADAAAVVARLVADALLHPAFDGHVARLAADVADGVAVRAVLDGVVDAAAAVALRGSGHCPARWPRAPQLLQVLLPAKVLPPAMRFMPPTPYGAGRADFLSARADDALPPRRSDEMRSSRDMSRPSS